MVRQGVTEGSPGRTRTYDKAVNSRLLYQLSYRGSVGNRIEYLMPFRSTSGDLFSVLAFAHPKTTGTELVSADVCVGRS